MRKVMRKVVGAATAVTALLFVSVGPATARDVPAERVLAGAAAHAPAQRVPAPTAAHPGPATGRPAPAGRQAARMRPEPTIHFDARARVHPVRPFLSGVNQRFYRRGVQQTPTETPPGELPSGGSPDSGLVRQIRTSGIALLRYPGGTAGHFFDWKKAIGPASERGCQVSGVTGRREDSRYGPDEQQRLAGAAGAETQLMVPYLSGTAADAADWVEYMNNPVSGPNINGGVDWAAERAANGHRAPYGITRWEIGNEPFFQVHRRWMPSGEAGSAGYRRAMRIYTLGGTVTQHRQPVGKACSHSPRSALVKKAERFQTYRVYYPPVTPFRTGDDQRVWVGGQWDASQRRCVAADLGEPWHEVDRLRAAGPQERAYAFDDETGRIRFGSGRSRGGQWRGHGRIPAAGSCVWASYRSGPHDGFRTYYRAMQRVDAKIGRSNIEVCSAWGRPEWPAFAARHRAGRAVRYDCLVTHPYRILKHRWRSAEQAYTEHVRGEAMAHRQLLKLAQAVDSNTPRAWHTYLAASEYGFIAGGFAKQPAFPDWRSSLMRTLYDVTQRIRFADAGLPWAEGGMLLTGSDDGVISGPPRYFYSASARGRQVTKQMLAAGGRTVRHYVSDNPQQRTRWGSYSALVTTASRTRKGDLYLLVVNRDPDDAVRARVEPRHVRWRGRATVWRLQGPSYRSVNTAAHPDRVRVVRTHQRVGRKPFRMRFEKHSVTVLKLRRSR